MGRFAQLFRNTLGDDLKGMMNALKGNLYMLRHYSWKRDKKTPCRPMVVFNVTRDFYSGGMADRFKGAVTAYAYCRYHGIDFRIRYIYPFELSDYLSPASYDWRLRDGEYTECIRDARLMYARAEHGRRLMRRGKPRKQLHFYGNYDNLEHMNRRWGTDFRWGELYRELFRPGPRLEEALKRKREAIGSSYVSAVFRFQNLLGDFQEYSFTALEDEDRRKELMQTCIDGLLELQSRQPGKAVLVTSDSSSFVSAVSDLPGIHVIGGSRVHIGSSASEDSDAYLNSFIDFYMLAGSEHVYCLGTRLMYPSRFPEYAAKIHDIPFERIRL